MTDIQTDSLAPQPGATIARRVSTPLMLFTGSLFMLLVLSWTLLLPQYTNFHVNGDLLSPREIAIYERDRQQELMAMEEKRNRLVLPVLDAAYDRLKQEKRDVPSVSSIREELRQAAIRAEAGQGEIITQSLTVDRATRAVSVTGDVRNVGPRSMTLLAEYVTQLESIPQFTGLTRPAFSRTDDEGIGIHSPFAFTFTLADRE